MNTLRLELFVSISKTLNFTTTSYDFYMSQSAVSSHIRALENKIGIKLINRDTHNVSLTQEGVAFVGYAKSILDLQIAAKKKLHSISKGLQGYLRIALVSSATQHFSKCLAEFSRFHPHVKLDVDVKEGTKMMQAIRENNYDIYFTNFYTIANCKDIEYLITGTQNLRLYIHREIANDFDINDWTTLQKHRFVSVPETDFALSKKIRAICHTRGLEPDIINYYNRADALLLAVNSNIGMTILPVGLMYSYDYPNIISLPIEGDDTVIKSVVAWHKNMCNPDAQKFIILAKNIMY